MKNSMTHYLEGVKEYAWKLALRQIMKPVVDRYSSQSLTSAGLVISAGGATTAKTGATDFYAVAQGVLVKVTAATTMPALTGINMTAGSFNVVCFYVSSAGTVTVAGGTQGATLGAVVWPAPPVGAAFMGALLITYASAFTGGTTPLDTATTIYLNPVGGAFDPTVLV